MAVSIRDIAREAGVTVGTVSRALLILFSTKTVFGTVYTAVFQKRFCCDFFIL